VANQDTIIITDGAPIPPAEEGIARERHISRYDGIAIASGAIGLAAIVWSIVADFPPFIPVLAVFLLLYSVREYRSARSIMTTTGLLFVLWIGITVSGLLFPFIIGFVVAYLFNPLVTHIHKRWKIARAWSSIVIVLALCSVLGLLGWLIAPTIVNEAEALLHNLADFFEHNSYSLDEEAIRRFLVSIGIPNKYVTSYLNEQLYPALKQFASTLPQMVLSVVSALPAVIQRIVDLILIPVSAIYFLKDWPSIGSNLLSLLPPNRRPHWKLVLSNIDKVLYGYIRGQTTVAAIMGILAGTLFTITGVPYASLLGVVLALFDLIPIVGLIASILVVETVIMITMPITFGNIMLGVSIIVALHMLEAYILGPRIVGKGVGIPPVLIIMSIFIFGYFLGFIGMLIAVPTTGIILLFVREYRQALPKVAVAE
jgi:predicted PurR-regulated permease PerM